MVTIICTQCVLRHLYVTISVSPKREPIDKFYSHFRVQHLKISKDLLFSFKRHFVCCPVYFLKYLMILPYFYMCLFCVFNLKNYILLEYRDISSLSLLSANVNQFPNLRRIPIESRFLYFRPSHHRSSSSGIKTQKVLVSDLDACRLCDDDLQTCSTVIFCLK